MISEQFYENTIIISVHGYFDDETAHEFRPTVQRAYRMGFREFVFNLKAVTSINTFGMTQLLFTGHDLRQKGCKRSIVDPPTHIRQKLGNYHTSTFPPIVAQKLSARTAR